MQCAATVNQNPTRDASENNNNYYFISFFLNAFQSGPGSTIPQLERVVLVGKTPTSMTKIRIETPYHANHDQGQCLDPQPCNHLASQTILPLFCTSWNLDCTIILLPECRTSILQPSGITIVPVKRA